MFYDPGASPRFEQKLHSLGWHLSADIQLDAVFIENSSEGKVLLLTALEARNPEPVLRTRLGGLPGADKVDFFPPPRYEECGGDEDRIA